jgi:hypothetical protein
MTHMVRILLAVVMVSLLLIGVVGHAGETSKPDATFIVEVEQAVPPGGGMGVTWGKGTLTMADGSKQQFSVEGLGVRGNREGIRDLQAHGDVYNLKKADDFAGTYKSAPQDRPAGADPKAAVSKNQNGVVVAFKAKTLTATVPDLELTPSETGVTVKLEK